MSRDELANVLFNAVCAAERANGFRGIYAMPWGKVCEMAPQWAESFRIAADAAAKALRRPLTTQSRHAGKALGGRRRAEVLSPERRQEIASKAAKARWNRVQGDPRRITPDGG